MKKLLLLLLFSFLFQSCFTYKSVNFNDIKNEKKQKFEVSKLDKTNIKGRLVFIDENAMILENRNGNQTINENEIYDVKVRKFSILKLATGIVGTYGAFVVIGVLALASFAL
ncbi:hypothetical protein OAJ28_00895 [Flavobacteriaceae bacterium]|jgi:hypothetical protein|nr:hypothetical protein [Flavobacteriaceae bacterium]